MNCKKTSDMLYDFTRNELTAPEMTAVETHLKICPACALELEKVKNLRAYFKTGMREPSPAVLANIRKAVPGPKQPVLFMIFKPALAMAAAIMLLVGVFSYKGIERKATLSNTLMEDYNLTETYVSDISDFDQASYIYGNDYDNEIF
jgi:anti-sigma factor RsiW